MTQEELYQENYPIVYGYLLSLCGDIHLAEDLTAETFFMAFLHPRRYDGHCKLSTWLCTIGRNLFLNECRRKRKLTALEAAEYVAVPSAETVVMEKATLEEIWRILQGSVYEHRQVFLMRLEGMAFRDIGLALGKTENWARVTYFRIKSKILQEMEGDI